MSIQGFCEPARLRAILEGEGEGRADFKDNNMNRIPVYVTGLEMTSHGFTVRGYEYGRIARRFSARTRGRLASLTWGHRQTREVIDHPGHAELTAACDDGRWVTIQLRGGKDQLLKLQAVSEIDEAGAFTIAGELEDGDDVPTSTLREKSRTGHLYSIYWQ